MKKNQSILLCFLLSINPLLAKQDLNISEFEKDNYVSVLKEREIEEQIRDSEIYKECYENASKKFDGDDENILKDRNDSIHQCFMQKIPKSDQDLKDLGSALDSKNYSVMKNKDSKELRDFLSKRLSKAIHGNNYKEDDISTHKLVGQDVFLKLFQNQLSKNLLTEVSGYCLEKVRYNDNGDYKFIEEAPNSNFSDSGWVEVKESDTTKNTDAESIKKFLERQFQQTDIEANLGGSVGKCKNAITAFCTRYNDAVKTANSTAPAGTKLSESEIADKVTDPTGKIACGLQAKLKEYRKALANIEIIKKQFDEIKDNQSEGFAIDFLKNQFYRFGSGQNEDSINEITTISSKEVKDAIDNQKQLEEFKNLGCDKPDKLNTDECKKFAQSDIKKLFDLEAEHNAQSAAKLEELKLLANPDKKSDLLKYLESIGLKDKAEELEKGTIDINRIMEIIEEKYIAERAAVISNLKEQFNYKYAKEDVSHNTGIVGNITKELEEKKDRSQAVFQYANVITSFLKVTHEDPANSLDPNNPDDAKKIEALKKQNTSSSGTITNDPNQSSKNVIGIATELKHMDEELGDDYYKNFESLDLTLSDNQETTIETDMIDQFLQN